MRLKDIVATPHPDGNRLDLRWVHPDPDRYPGVRVVRREGTYPTAPGDGILVAEGDGLHCVVDENLKGETVYYYALFPYAGDPPEYQIDYHNRTAAMATAPYDMAGQMVDLLPGIYHRYDEEQQREQLRRFLDLPGGQLDRLYSFARAALDLYDLDKVDGRLLPLLAGWIGWQTDHRQEIDSQRNEIRNAPSIYERIGSIPTVEATVRRIMGWESSTKEFVHNVFLSNRPARLNLWTCQRHDTGEWSIPTEPLSLDFAYEGRPTAAQGVRDGNDTVWLFYHTLRKDQWNIWYKTLSIFGVALSFQDDLDTGVVSTGLQRAFAERGFSLSPYAMIEKKDSVWQITDADNEKTYTARPENDQLNVYRWAPSQSLMTRTGLDKHPTAAVQNETLWVFWESYDETEHAWRIDYQTQGNDEKWSATGTFSDPGADTEPERRRPWAVVDPGGNLWLFWLEKVEAQWQLKYGCPAGDEESILLLPGSAKSFSPDDGGKSAQSDVFVLADPGSRLWVFWTYRVKVPTDDSPNQTRWRIAYRVKAGLDPAVDDWSSIHTLPQEPADYDCREPAAMWNGADGTVELFWSSNQDDSWSIWHTTLDTTSYECGTSERITGNPYSQRDPLPVSLGANTLLIYRSNESLAYTSQVYGATETLDTRYAGCTTGDAHNLSKIALWRQFEDFSTYTYDSGKNGERKDEDWYARDTVGIYLPPHIEDPASLERNQNLIKDVLRQFLPIQVRTVLAIPITSRELVYTYDFPGAESRRIGEQVFDSTIPETYLGLEDGRTKGFVPGWVLMRAWGGEKPELFRRSVDFTKSPIVTRFRTWHADLKLED